MLPLLLGAVVVAAAIAVYVMSRSSIVGTYTMVSSHGKKSFSLKLIIFEVADAAGNKTTYWSLMNSTLNPLTKTDAGWQGVLENGRVVSFTQEGELLKFTDSKLPADLVVTRVSKEVSDADKNEALAVPAKLAAQRAAEVAAQPVPPEPAPYTPTWTSASIFDSGKDNFPVINCPTGRVVSVRNAIYQGVNPAECAARDYTGQFNAYIAGRSSFKLDKNPYEIFGDPCFGVPKQFSVEYACV